MIYRKPIGALVIAALLPAGLALGQSGQSRSAPAPNSASSRPKPVSRYQDDPRLQVSLLLRPIDASGRVRQGRDSSFLAQFHPEEFPRLEQPGVLNPIRVIGAEVFRAQEILDALAEETGVRLKIQSDWRAVQVALPRRAREGREQMDLLVAAFGGKWFRIGDQWILAENEAIARFTALSEEEYHRLVMELQRRLFQGITPAQWERLAAGEQIPFHQLNPVQQRVILDELRSIRYGPAKVLRPNERPTAAAMRGRGVFLAVDGQGAGACLEIGVPSNRLGSRGTTSTRIRIAFMELNGRLLWGVAPPR